MALRKGAGRLSSSSDKERQDALLAVASALDSSREIIRKANEEDLKAAEVRGIQPALLKRLAFTDEKIDSSIQGLRELCQLPDPIGRTLEKRELDPGFVLERVSFPIGVIAMIFEARPDALVQIAGLVARRILCYKLIGEDIERGERYGFIRFGSRVDVYLPMHAEITVTIGEKTTGVETVIARLPKAA